VNNNSVPAQPATTGAPTQAVIATPAPVITAPVKVDRTRIVTHTVITRAAVKTPVAQRSAPEQNYVAPSTQTDNSQNVVAPPVVAPQNANETPQSTTNSATPPSNTNLTTAPSVAPVTPSQNTQTTPSTPNTTDQSNTPSPQ
jgi:hypothetical protein